MAFDTLLALDVGEKKTGVARANTIALLPEPYDTWPTNEVAQRLTDVIEQENVGIIVIGLPKNLKGEETQQTTFTREFVSQLNVDKSLKVVFFDETLSSVIAEKYLKKQTKNYDKRAIDSTAAAEILRNFIDHNYQALKNNHYEEIDHTQ